MIRRLQLRLFFGTLRPTVFFACTLAFIPQCKTSSGSRQLANSRNDGMDSNIEADLARVNGTTPRAAFSPGRQENLERYVRFIGNDRTAEIKFEDYKSLWEQYRFIVLRTGGREQEYDIRDFVVNLTIRQNRVAEQAPPLVPAVLGAQLQGLEKKCPAPQRDDEDRFREFVLQYKLLVYEQPTLARNFLILAKAGFFDGKRFGFSDKYRSLFRFGSDETMTQGETSPYFVAPDRVFTPPMPPSPEVTNNSTTAATEPQDDEPDPTASGELEGVVDISPYRMQRFRSLVPYAGLVGIAYNFAKGQDTRKMLGTTVAIAAYRLSIQDKNDRLVEDQVLPVMFAEPVGAVINGRRVTGDVAVKASVDNIVKTAVSPIPAERRTYDVVCAGIELAGTQPWPFSDQKR